MNNYSVTTTESALNDLKKIQAYLTSSFGYNVATKSIKEIIIGYSSLENLPNKGKQASDLINFLEGYRYLIINSNIVFYSIDQEKIEIKIHRIFSTREDFTQKFLQFTQNNKN